MSMSAGVAVVLVVTAVACGLCGLVTWLISRPSHSRAGVLRHVCVGCGNRFPIAARFCPQCGREVVGASPSSN